MPSFSRKSTTALGKAVALPNPRVVVVLDNIRSMHNVGSAFRSADAFGVAEVWLCGITPLPPHRDIQKTALGATETVPWRAFPQIIDALDAAEMAGLVLCAVEQAEPATPLHTLSQNLTNAMDVALIFGNEVSGVSDAALQRASVCVEIPQWGAKHSLNVAVAVGAVLWEIRRIACGQQ